MEDSWNKTNDKSINAHMIRSLRVLTDVRMINVITCKRQKEIGIYKDIYIYVMFLSKLKEYNGGVGSERRVGQCRERRPTCRQFEDGTIGRFL